MTLRAELLRRRRKSGHTGESGIVTVVTHTYPLSSDTEVQLRGLAATVNAGSAHAEELLDTYDPDGRWRLSPDDAAEWAKGEYGPSHLGAEYRPVPLWDVQPDGGAIPFVRHERPRDPDHYLPLVEPARFSDEDLDGDPYTINGVHVPRWPI